MHLVTPRATEKAYAAQTQNTYIFDVPTSMSKQAIAKEVAEQFKVTVLDVRTTNRKGKATKFRRGKHAYPGTTYRQDKKYAYVTLKDGDKIKVFDEEPVADKAEAAKTTKIKAADEKQSAETKKAGLFTKRRTGNRGDK